MEQRDRRFQRNVRTTPSVALGFVTFEILRNYYYAMLALLCIASSFAFSARPGPASAGLQPARRGRYSGPGHRRSVDALSSIGIRDLQRYRWVGGSFNAHFIQGISPPDIAPAVSVFIVVMVMAGGVRFLLGPVVGAVILTVVPEMLRASAEWSMVVYGVFLVGYVFLFRRWPTQHYLARRPIASQRGERSRARRKARGPFG